MAKLTDVAKIAGVSPTTVSRVINNHGSLSETTKYKVFAAMQKLNYQPNSLARSLQGKKTKLIGLIFSGVGNPFFGEMVQSVEDQLFDKGYRVILCNSADNKEKEREYLRMLMANQVDGIIAGSHNLGIKEYNQVGLPIISFDRYLSDNVPIVSSDNYLGGQDAAKKLVSNNVKRPYIITGSNKPKSPTNARLNGFQNIMKSRNIEANTLELGFEMRPALKAMRIKQLLQNKNPDGIFCTDDLTALLVENQAAELEINIPGSLKLVGYDGTQFIQNYHPELTTIMQPIQDITTLMIDLLIQKIEDPTCKFEENYVLPIKVVSGTTA